MKIVKFKDGAYGIRRWSWLYLEYRFLDLFSKQEFWWNVKSKWLHHAQSDDLQLVKEKYKQMSAAKNTNSDIGKPI